MVTAAMKLKDTPWKKSYDKTSQHIKKQTYFADKGLYGQSYGFSSSHVWVWELDHKESWALERIDLFKLWCWRRPLRDPKLHGDLTSPS